ncbi:exported hypothetical protein [Nitrosotalea sinensis]|uniref:Uncharacterized protein n=1 Tax=Nitrosotalea sinensis TaxID=1499975 RepID=A0A2H1EHC2_9ARCH|nr:hypothetical protein [Candidatus Nitrosotalea sinensis]SHO45981.1 exported hypothetical protein [Candidatus Nitrosotalea sinensis]
MKKNYLIPIFSAFVILGITQVFAWAEYTPVIFVGDISQIYSSMPTFHGYTTEFLNSQEVKQVCLDASNDGVKLDYCP